MIRPVSEPRVDVALVTGASGGIGREIAVSVSEISEVTFLAGRDPKRLSETAKYCLGDTVTIQSDVLDPGAFQAVVDHMTTVPPLKRLVVVAAAGVVGPISPPGSEDPKDWIDVIETNLIGAYLTLAPFLSRLGSASWARLVMVSSAQSLHGPDAVMSAYATSKFAVNVYAASLAAHFNGTAVSVCSIHPGDVFTEMGRDILAKSRAAGQDAEHLTRWANDISSSSDDAADAAGLIRRIVREPASWSNGRFLLTESSVGRHPETSWTMPVGPTT